VKWNTPDEEFNGLTRYLFALNAENPEAIQAETCIVAPNKQWAHAFSQMLAKRGFSVSSLGFERLAGDPRDMSRAKALAAYTALNLIAEPEDLFAWRAWLGFGKYLTLYDGWKFLLAWCDEHDASVFDALDAASAARAAGEAEPYPRAERLAERYDAGRALIEGNRARRGHALLAAVGAEGLRDFAALADRIVGDEDAAALYAAARATQFAPVHEDNPRAVRVSSYEQMCGCSYRAVYAVGCVDGFVPARDAFEVVSTDADRARVRETGRRAFAAAAGKASDALMFSTFTHGIRRARGHLAPHLFPRGSRRGSPHHLGRPGPPGRYGHRLAARQHTRLPRRASTNVGALLGIRISRISSHLSAYQPLNVA